MPTGSSYSIYRAEADVFSSALPVEHATEIELATDINRYCLGLDFGIAEKVGIRESSGTSVTLDWWTIWR